MTDYKATPEQWARLERWAWAGDIDTDCCIIELRARIEQLETMRETEKAAVLDLYQQHDKLKEWVGKNYLRIKALEGNPQPTSNDRQIRSSLVSQVAIAISRCEDSAAWDDEALNWAPEARAAILEVARWLRTSTDISHGPRAADWLEREAEQ